MRLSRDNQSDQWQLLMDNSVLHLLFLIVKRVNVSLIILRRCFTLQRDYFNAVRIDVIAVRKRHW